MLTFCTLASGSSGNAALVSCGDTHILLDAGISARRITAGLAAVGLAPGQLSAILITHAHSDHTTGLATLLKKLEAPVYASEPTLCQLLSKLPALGRLGRGFTPGSAFSVGALEVDTFPTPHDCPGSVGYALSGGGAKLALATDLGHLSRPVLEGVLGCDALLCETNHDVDWLRSGPYPYPLQQRVLGDYGHLSNEAGAELAVRAAQAGARTIVLSHLSHQNNTPARALEAVLARLRGAGFDPEGELTVQVAPRSQPGPVLQVAPAPARAEARVC